VKKKGERMIVRRAVFLAALAAVAGPACYESHADRVDASPTPPDADAAPEARADDGGPTDDATARDDAVVPDDGGTICPGDDILDAAELLRRRLEFDGSVVRVRGTVADTGPGACTTRECPDDRPCCNTCTAELRLVGADGTGPLLQGTGAASPGCYGDECHLVCTPYDVGRVYVLRGTFFVPPGRGPVLTVTGAPADVCQESPPPDHRGAYHVWAKSSSVSGECDRFLPLVGGQGFVFASVGDPGQLEMWQGMATAPGSGRQAGTIEPAGSRATFRATATWACCEHSFSGVFGDSRSIEATFAVHEEGLPACDATFELVGMREDAPCAETDEPDACFASGGIHAFVGPDTGEVCSCPTFDGHETCASDAQCEASCMAEPVDGGCAAVTTGYCAKGYRWAGCYCWLERGPASAPTCWD
jgi:hypothetical protein